MVALWPGRIQRVARTRAPVAGSGPRVFDVIANASELTLGPASADRRGSRIDHFRLHPPNQIGLTQR